MPVHRGVDKIGNYFQWGNVGKKYYYYNETTCKNAKKRATKQGRAITANR